jgi:multiple sugar transport system substrate-binding protein
MPLPRAGATPISNFWTWSMAMNSSSKNKGAAWLFLQYFTSKEFALYASVEMNNLDPARTSVWDSSGFKNKMASHEGWLDTFNKTINSTTILFTPQPMFFQTTTEWAATLQDMVAGRQSVQAALDDLKRKTDAAVRDVSVR